MTFLGFFRPTQKIAWEGPEWGQEVLFPAHPDLADIFGRMDFDFENFYFLDSFGFQISRCPGPRFPNFQKSGLGPAWAWLGPAQLFTKEPIQPWSIQPHRPNRLAASAE